MFYFFLPGPYFSQNKSLTFSLDSIFKALCLWPLQHLCNALKASRASVCFYSPFFFNHLLPLPQSFFVLENMSYLTPQFYLGKLVKVFTMGERKLVAYSFKISIPHRINSSPVNLIHSNPNEATCLITFVKCWSNSFKKEILFTETWSKPTID